MVFVQKYSGKFWQPPLFQICEILPWSPLCCVTVNEGKPNFWWGTALIFGDNLVLRLFSFKLTEAEKSLALTHLRYLPHWTCNNSSWNRGKWATGVFGFAHVPHAMLEITACLQSYIICLKRSTNQLQIAKSNSLQFSPKLFFSLFSFPFHPLSWKDPVARLSRDDHF